MVHKTRCLCISFGLLWLLMWGLYGTFLGLEQRQSLFAEPLWQVTFRLETALHNHMNVMALGLIAIAGQLSCLSAPLRGWGRWALVEYAIGMCLFGVGLGVESLHPVLYSPVAFVGLFITSLGAVLYLTSLAILSLLFFVSRRSMVNAL